MRDHMLRAVTRCGHFRAVAALTTGVVETLRKLQGASPVATAALGRAITGAFLLASEFKGRERVVLQILGDGPLQEVYAEAAADGTCRGYVRRPGVDLPAQDGKLPVGEAVGQRGTFTVMKDLGLREPYRGVVPLTTGEIARDLAYYLLHSEQIPSAVALGVYSDPCHTVTAAGGYLVQTLPSATDEEIDQVEENIRGMPLPTDLIRQGASPKEILRDALQGFELKFLEEKPLRFHCPCSRDRVAGALVALGSKELESLVQRNERVDIRCEFCGRPYIFSPPQLQELLAQAAERP
jgi:molecular chaperone Hsp33